ncbi:hypothetical protein OROGR_026456 [Orobanche gracilis]
MRQLTGGVSMELQRQLYKNLPLKCSVLLVALLVVKEIGACLNIFIRKKETD